MTMTQLDDYYPDAYSQPLLTEPVSDDYAKLLHCLWLFGGSLVLAGLIYIFLKDVKIAVVVCGVVAVGLTLFHTPFGLFILFSLLAIENAVVLNPNFTISKAMGIVLLLSFLVKMYRTGLTLPTPLKLAIALMCWAICSALWSIAPFYYTLLNSTTLILNIGLAVIILNTIKDQKSLFLVISGFALGGFAAFLITISGHVTYAGSERIGRVALHDDTSPVVLALALCIGFLAACFAFFQPGKIKKILATVVMVSLFLTMIKTQSRMPTFAALSIPVFALILSSRSENRLKYFFIAVIVAVIAVVAVRWAIQSDLLTEEARKRLGEHGFEESGRLQFWKWGLQAFAHRPIHGYGLNNFTWIPTNLANKSAHNNVVAISVDLGLVGFALLAMIFVTLYKQIIRISDSALRWLGFALFLYPLITGITTTTYIKKEFWYVLGIMMTVINIGILQEQKKNELLRNENAFNQSDVYDGDYESQQY